MDEKYNCALLEQCVRSTAIPTRTSLLTGVRRGDEESWKEFYETYEVIVVGEARKKGVPEDQAKDVVQEVMARLHRMFGEGFKRNRAKRFLALVRRVAKHRSIDMVRKLSRFTTRIARGGEVGESSTDLVEQAADLKFSAGSDANLTLEQVKLAIARVLERVSQRDALIVQMVFFDALEISEVAENLDITAASVRTAIWRMRKLIKAELSKLRDSECCGRVSG